MLVYARKYNLRNSLVVNTSEFAKKTDFTNLKSDIGELNTDKLKNCGRSFKQCKM